MDPGGTVMHAVAPSALIEPAGHAVALVAPAVGT
jgi:hypothetical protein